MSANRRDAANFIRLIAAAALFTVTSLPTGAQDNYPNHPVRIIVPYAAGGIAGVLAHLLGEKLTAKWGQAFIVESRPGASGNIGAEAVARAAPDGYTLLVSPPPPLAINQSLFPKLSYDPSAFVPVTVIAMVPNVLVVHPAVPASNVKELIVLAKTQPGKLNYASTGNGGTPHLTAEQLKAVTGVRIVHIPYNGVPAALTDLMGGQVDMMFINLGDALPHIKSGKLKVLGVASDGRIATLPDVPGDAARRARCVGGLARVRVGYLVRRRRAPEDATGDRRQALGRDCRGTPAAGCREETAGSVRHAGRKFAG